MIQLGPQLVEILSRLMNSEELLQSVQQISSGPAAAGLRFLDACFDDVAFARYLVSKPKNEHKVANRSTWRVPENEGPTLEWRDRDSGVGLLHCLVYNDLSKPLLLLLESGTDPNMVNKVLCSFLLFNHPIKCFYHYM